MNYEYLKNRAEEIKIEINKTDIKCHDIQILFMSSHQVQFLFTLTKQNKIYRDLETINYDDITIKLPKIMKEKIRNNMIEVIK